MYYVNIAIIASIICNFCNGIDPRLQDRLMHLEKKPMLRSHQKRIPYLSMHKKGLDQINKNGIHKKLGSRSRILLDIEDVKSGVQNITKGAKDKVTLKMNVMTH